MTTPTMPTIPETPMIPAHTPIVVCPTCTRHTAHVVREMGQYDCLICHTAHPLVKPAKIYRETETIWCPKCRVDTGSPFWAPVQGRRQCRVCQRWLEVAKEHDDAQLG
jgi:hypothetical protein